MERAYEYRHWTVMQLAEAIDGQPPWTVERALETVNTLGQQGWQVDSIGYSFDGRPLTFMLCRVTERDVEYDRRSS